MQFVGCAFMYVLFAPELLISFGGTAIHDYTPAQKSTWMQGQTVYYYSLVVAQIAA